MISKQEIMALGAELQLQAHVVEKDYALGWLLAGIAGKTCSLIRIHSATVTRQTFHPRFAVELTASGPLAAPPLERAHGSKAAPSTSFSAAPRTSPRPRQTKATGNFGMNYSFECTVCGKRFTRSTYDATLNPHKNKQGSPCPGRVGFPK